MGQTKTMYGKIMEGLKQQEIEEANRPENWQPKWYLIGYKGFEGKIFSMVPAGNGPSKKYSDIVYGYGSCKCLVEHKDEVVAELIKQGYKIVSDDYQ